MNVKEILKKALPYVLIVVGFVVIAYTYAPQVLQGNLCASGAAGQGGESGGYILLEGDVARDCGVE